MIGNRKITVAAALITLAACLFTLVFLLWPQSLHITAASSSPDYLSLFDPMEVLSVEITVDTPRDWSRPQKASKVQADCSVQPRMAT